MFFGIGFSSDRVMIPNTFLAGVRAGMKGYRAPCQSNKNVKSTPDTKRGHTLPSCVDVFPGSTIFF
jgi:hypothetical protein